MSAWFDELAEFLRIPSISADPAHAGHVAEAGEWVCNFIREAGGEAELVDWKGQPLAIGELRASAANGAPTVLCYGHFDVQPPDPLELWESEPFEPEIRGDYLYGRGTVDDKGQLYMLLAAARELARAGELPVNVRFTCDGEEETAGHTLVDFIAADERGADAAVIFDSGNGDPGYVWSDVQQVVGKLTRACWFDRAGEGWSDTGPFPRTSAAMSTDLHELLHRDGSSSRCARASSRRPKKSSPAGASCRPARRSSPSRVRNRWTSALPRSSTCGRSPSRPSRFTASRAARRSCRRR